MFLTTKEKQEPQTLLTLPISSVSYIRYAIYSSRGAICS
nr:MAG TPA: hypothetical protein [Caudoviricetes sp.]